MKKNEQVNLYYCSTCKEIAFRWSDINTEYVVQDRFTTESGEQDYGECETIDSKYDSNECMKGHTNLDTINISQGMFKKIFAYEKDSFPINIPEEYLGTKLISDEDFNNLLLESGVANLNGGK